MKLLPGAAKRGKAVQEALAQFFRHPEVTGVEKVRATASAAAAAPRDGSPRALSSTHSLCLARSLTRPPRRAQDIIKTITDSELTTVILGNVRVRRGASRAAPVHGDRGCALTAVLQVAGSGIVKGAKGSKRPAGKKKAGKKGDS